MGPFETFVQSINTLISEANLNRTDAVDGRAKREYALAITALEDAQMRFNRGRAIVANGEVTPFDFDTKEA